MTKTFQEMFTFCTTVKFIHAKYSLRTQNNYGILRRSSKNHSITEVSCHSITLSLFNRTSVGSRLLGKEDF